MVELLLSKDASIEARNIYGYIPLYLAARNGQAATVELLLRKGASIDVGHYTFPQRVIQWSCFLAKVLQLKL